MGINREEQFLCNALAEVLAGKEPPHPEKRTDMDRVLELAYAHKVHPLLYECSDLEEVSAEWRERLKRESRKIVSQNYRLLFLTKYLTSVLEENGIGTAVLKGVGVAQLYPVPEARKSGDIDLLIPYPAQFEQAVCVLENQNADRRAAAASRTRSGTRKNCGITKTAKLTGF